MNTSEATMRSVLSFFASPAHVQLAYLQDAHIAFFPPAAKVSSKANYLAGIYSLFALCKASFLSARDLPDNSSFGELAEALESAYALRPHAVWEPNELSHHPAWREIRLLAARVLADNGVPLESPLAPVDITEAAYEFGWRDVPEL